MQMAPNTPPDALELQKEPNENGLEMWGDDRVVYHESEGVWIMYDPEDDVLERENWR